MLSYPGFVMLASDNKGNQSDLKDFISQDLLCEFLDTHL